MTYRDFRGILLKKGCDTVSVILTTFLTMLKDLVAPLSLKYLVGKGPYYHRIPSNSYETFLVFLRNIVCNKGKPILFHQKQ